MLVHTPDRYEIENLKLRLEIITDNLRSPTDYRAKARTRSPDATSSLSLNQNLLMTMRS